MMKNPAMIGRALVLAALILSPATGAAAGGDSQAKGEVSAEAKAAMERHFAQGEPAAMPGSEQSMKTDEKKGVDPTSSKDAMVSYFTTDVPEDVTVAARRPQVDLDIKFDFDSSELSGDGIEQLDTAGQALSDPRLSSRRFMLGGHTDDRGDEKYNRMLSKRRAESARQYLIEEHGISPDRLETAGFGSDHPKDGEKTSEARKRNRRVVLEMIE
jgi:outer membrane protein OmpA-like peptidoglycan-associated protein